MTKSKIEVTSNFLNNPQPTKSNFSLKNKTRKKFKAPVITTVGIIAIFLVVIVAIFALGIFNVKNYKVTGNLQVTTSEITDIVKKAANNKLIIDVNPVSIEQELLTKFPLLSYVRVSKELPSTLSIDVKERSKSAVIKTLENTVLVSSDGIVLEEIEDSKIQNNMYQDITVVKLIEEPKRQVGDKFDTVFIGSISSLLNNWKKNNSPTFTDVLIDKDKNVKIALSSGSTVIISIQDKDLDLDKLISDFNSLYNRLSQGSKKIKTIDMRYDNKASVIYM